MFDLNKLQRQAASRAESGIKEEKLIPVEPKKSLTEKIAAFEQASREEQEQIAGESDTTPESYLSKLKVMEKLRSGE